MDLRLVRFRAWQLGFVPSPPPCQGSEGQRCWCFFEPAATRGANGKLTPHGCPPKPPEEDSKDPVTVIVSLDEV
jgi:hypothetical protein